MKSNIFCKIKNFLFVFLSFFTFLFFVDGCWGLDVGQKNKQLDTRFYVGLEAGVDRTNQHAHRFSVKQEDLDFTVVGKKHEDLFLWTGFNTGFEFFLNNRWFVGTEIFYHFLRSSVREISEGYDKENEQVLQSNCFTQPKQRYGFNVFIGFILNDKWSIKPFIGTDRTNCSCVWMPEAIGIEKATVNQEKKFKFQSIGGGIELTHHFTKKISIGLAASYKQSYNKVIKMEEKVDNYTTYSFEKKTIFRSVGVGLNLRYYF